MSIYIKGMEMPENCDECPILKLIWKDAIRKREKGTYRWILADWYNTYGRI